MNPLYTTHYTPIELSKLIHERVPSVETGMWWNTRTGKLTRFPKRHEWSSYMDEGSNDVVERVGYENERAYRLDDIIRAVQVWGEKQGWWESGTGSHEKMPLTVNDYCHSILTAFLADGPQFGPKSEDVIRNIFEGV